MLKQIPLYAAVMFLCACTSVPTIKFPTGSGARIAINAPAKAQSVELADPAGVPHQSEAQRIVAKQPSTPAVVEAPPEPILLKVYLVNGNERSLLGVLRRWARVARVDFTWEADVDYPVTARMRDIYARDLESAVEQIGRALEGVRLPLAMSVTAEGLIVQNGEVAPAPVVATEPVVATLPAVETPAATDASTKGPEKAPVVIPDEWTVGDAKTLRAVLERWTAAAGLRLVWDSQGDEPVTDLVRQGVYAGSLREALGQLAAKFGEFKTPLGMKFLENETVLRVYDMAAAS